MNQVLREGAEMAQLGWLMGLTTILFFVTMVGWTLWAFAPSQKQRMEEDARIPLDGGAS